MPKNRIVIFGILIALLPILGFPRAWEAFFQVAVGLSLIVFSVWARIDKKLTLKAKAQQRQAQKIASEASVSPLAPDKLPQTPGRRVTDFYPRTAPPGRRLTDINPTLGPDEENR